VWIRLILIGILFFLVIRLIGKSLARGQKKNMVRNEKPGNNKKKQGGVPGDLGEYVDYEEVDED